MRRVRGAKGLTVRQWRYQCYAQIVMRDAWLLDDIVRSLGYGWASPYKQATEKHSSYHNFGVTGLNLQRFCEEVGPLLRLKRKQSILVLEVCLLKRKIGNQPVNDIDYERQVEIWNELRALNAKGPTRPEAMRELIRPIVPVAVAAWEKEP